MRRLAALALLAAVAVAAVAITAGPAAGEDRRYRVMLDNAFGLIEGADVKVAGVRSGKVEKLDVDRDTARAVVTIVITNDGFGRLREDVFCRVEPQSLIGEYFLNCEPGTSPQELRAGATIPVEQTGTTVPADLVNNIMRRPFRERLGILLNEFGVAFGARGPELNATIKRAVPALREVDRVLKILAENRREIQSATSNGATVLTALAAKREDVARFVGEARDTAQASANRRGELARTFRLFPTFLREFRPVLRALETTADRQTPALRDLRASADDLETLFRRLGPFSEASRPAIRSLGRTGASGRRDVTVARGTVSELRRTAGVGKDPVRNLRFVLEHIDDRKFAVEDYADIPDPGLTGLEALLQYPFFQSQAINLVDIRGYSLKLNALINQCTGYNDASVYEDEAKVKACSAALGPGIPPVEQQYGDDEPDRPPPSEARRASAQRSSGTAAPAEAGADGGPSGAAAPAGGERSLELPGVGSIRAPSVPGPAGGASEQASGQLLDYLLGG